MSAPYEAQWRSTCPSCDGPIRPGDEVRAVDDTVVHESCYVFSMAAPGDCQTCWLPHAGACPS